MRRHRRRAAIAAVGAACLTLCTLPRASGQPDPAPTPAPTARTQTPTEVELRLRTGARLTGLLVREDDQDVVLKINGVETRVARLDIEARRDLPPARERYRQIRATIAAEDAETRLRLVQWLQTRELYDEALFELDLVERAAPGDPRTARLRKLIEAQRAIANPSTRQPTQPTPDRPARLTIRDREQEFGVISSDDVNVLRVYEVDLRRPPRMIVARETIDELITRYADHELMPVGREGRAALYRLPAAEVLDLMFRMQARDLYGRVQVAEHPKAFALFRNHVHGAWLINACATSRCHGGAEAGRFRLWSHRPNSDRTVYTNFLAIDRYRLPDGTPLIDYDNPARSPLLQMAIPREDSRFPHPKLPETDRTPSGWRPVLGATDTRRFRRAIEWIESLYEPRPTYPVDFVPPGMRERGVAEPFEGPR